MRAEEEGLVWEQVRVCSALGVVVPTQSCGLRIQLESHFGLCGVPCTRLSFLSMVVCVLHSNG